MPIGMGSDFKVYPEQFYGGSLESMAQAVVGFNAASLGTLLLASRNVKGEYKAESFMQDIAGIIRRRNPATMAGVSDTPMTMGEMISVKVNRGIGPVAQTLDAWKKISADPQEFSFKFGQMTGTHKAAEMLNTVLLCLNTALAGVSALKHTVASSAILSVGEMVKGLAKLGDQSQRVTAWVMHSKPFHDILAGAITDKVYGVANIAVYQGTTGSLGRPMIVTDSPALVANIGTSSTPVYQYHTLGLVGGAAIVEESEDQSIVSQEITGLENLAMRIQGEYAYNIGLRGFTYDFAGGGANPDDTALGTAAYWDTSYAYDKNRAGIVIYSA